MSKILKILFTFILSSSLLLSLDDSGKTLKHEQSKAEIEDCISNIECFAKNKDLSNSKNIKKFRMFLAYLSNLT